MSRAVSRSLNGMAHEEIDGVPIWYEEHGDPDGPPLVALHGGILTFDGSFGDVLPWLTQGRRVIGVELQGHGHTPDTGRPMSIERFADDVAELSTGSRSADRSTCGFQPRRPDGDRRRHPAPPKVRRLVLAAVNIRPDGYHPEITAPEQDDPRLPTEQEFAGWQAAYEAVAPNPDDFFPFLERIQPVVHDWPAGPTTRSDRSPRRRSSSSATRTSSASTTPPRCSTSSRTAASPSCPTRSTPRSCSDRSGSPLVEPFLV